MELKSGKQQIMLEVIEIEAFRTIIRKSRKENAMKKKS